MPRHHRKHHSTRIKTPDSARRWLANARERLPPERRAEIQALGKAMVPLLIEVLNGQAKDRYSYWAAVDAANILGNLKAAEAVDALLRAISRDEAGNWLNNDAAVALERMDSDATEALLAALPRYRNQQGHLAILTALARSARGDARVRQALIDDFPGNPEFLAGTIATFSDPSLLPLLSDALDHTPLDVSEFGDDNTQLIVELVEAIELLGGTLTPNQQARDAMVQAQRRAWRAYRSL